MRLTSLVAAIAFIAIPAFAAGVEATGALPAQIAGVYKTRFKNALVGGETYVSENILEVVPYRNNAAYFRLHLDFYNGHECSISGIAQATADTLIYRGPDDVDGHPCVLSLRRARDGIHISEGENGACRNQTCGARGGYGFKPDGVADFPLASRRSIRYLPRLLASSQYDDAVKEFAAKGAPH